MQTCKIIKEVKDPKVLVVTPLLPGHEISKETKKSLKRNDLPFTWIASEGENNIPTNLENGLNWYEKEIGSLPDFYMMIDRDIIAGRHLIDRLYARLRSAAGKPQVHGSLFVAFAYASFEFKGYVNHKFPAVPYNPTRLCQANYISSNSMFVTEYTKQVGLVKDEKYKRLLDWAFLLKLLYNGLMGVACPEASFVAMSTEKDISAGSSEDYQLKSRRVYEDFIVPIIEKYSSPSP